MAWHQWELGPGHLQLLWQRKQYHQCCHLRVIASQFVRQVVRANIKEKLLAFCEGNLPVTSEFRHIVQVMRKRFHVMMCFSYFIYKKTNAIILLLTLWFPIGYVAWLWLLWLSIITDYQRNGTGNGEFRRFGSKCTGDIFVTHLIRITKSEAFIFPICAIYFRGCVSGVVVPSYAASFCRFHI